MDAQNHYLAKPFFGSWRTLGSKEIMHQLMGDVPNQK